MRNRVERAAIYAIAVAGKLRKRLRWTTPADQRITHLRTDFYKRVWHDAAGKAGVPISAVHGSLLRIEVGSRPLLVQRNTTSLDDAVTIAIAMDKQLVARLLGRQGITTPRSEVFRFDDVGGAWAYMRTIGRPCVIKPAKLGIGGLGVTTDVRSRLELVMAMGHGRVYDRELLVEEMVEGDVYRLLYLDGELLDAVHRSPPTLVGDGLSTVAQLIDKENQDRALRGAEAAQTMLKIDRDLRVTVRRAGYRLSSVPPAGARFRVKRVINDNRREENLAATHLLCPALVETGAAAAAAVGVRFAGVDIITTDPSVPLGESEGVVLEVNAEPGLYYHYMKAGDGVPIAELVLRRLLSRQTR